MPPHSREVNGMDVLWVGKKKKKEYHLDWPRMVQLLLNIAQIHFNLMDLLQIS